MQNWEASMPPVNYEHNWYGNMFPAAIKSEPRNSPTLPSLLDHNNAFVKAANSIEMNSLTPSPRTSDQSNDDHNNFFDVNPTLTASLLMNHHHSSQHPLGFNPLTPPGLPNAVLPPMNFHSTSSHKQQLHHHETKHQPVSQHSNQHESILQEKIEHNSLTPRNTPPMDITPPKSPKLFSEYLEKDPEIQSNSSELLESENEDTTEVIRLPNYNSHGKIKNYKCKSCAYTSVTKLSFWQHAREHMKPEKILQCPKCPFVTELKHHLEYHIRKHKNLKPFQCDKCNYSCVNKSMLNSHAKSHSSVYQYRCSDCDYATKYCHSFKLHLRKYEHKPGLVLEDEGVPNPSIVIDVYGTRRGPKMKSSTGGSTRRSSSLKHDSRSMSQQSLNGPTNKMQMSQQKIVSPVKNDKQTPTSNLQNFLPNHLANILQQSHNMSSFLPYWNFQMFQQQVALAQLSPRLREATLQTLSSTNDFDKESNLNDDATEDTDQKSNGSAMDLSSCQDTPTKENCNVPCQSKQLLKMESQHNSEETNTPIISLSNSFRRKGRILQLENGDGSISSSDESVRINSNSETDYSRTEEDNRKEFSKTKVINESDIKDTPETKEESTDAITNQSAISTTSISNNNNNNNNNNNGNSLSPLAGIFECKYCDIYFKDAVLYTIHMGYHSCDDVFKCNMCGEKCDGPVGLFVHMARNAHS